MDLDAPPSMRNRLAAVEHSVFVAVRAQCLTGSIGLAVDQWVIAGARVLDSFSVNGYRAAMPTGCFVPAKETDFTRTRPDVTDENLHLLQTR
jgi:hypothetical protein